MSFGNKTIDFQGFGIINPNLCVFQAPQLEYDWETNPQGFDRDIGVAGSVEFEPLIVVINDTPNEVNDEDTDVEDNADTTPTNGLENTEDATNANGEQDDSGTSPTGSGMSRGDEETLARKEDETHVKGGSKENLTPTNTGELKGSLVLSLMAIGGGAYYMESKNKTFTKAYKKLKQKISKSIK
jgi:hypothetical protein